MQGQGSFSQAEYAGKKKQTRRDSFLAELEAVPGCCTLPCMHILFAGAHEHPAYDEHRRAPRQEADVPIDAVLDRNQFRGGLPYYDITIWPLRAGSGVMGGTRATVQVGGTASTERR